MENKGAKNKTRHLSRVLSDSQDRLNHIVNSLTGGVAVYRIADGHFITEYYSDGVPLLSGHTIEEYDKVVERDAVEIVDPNDRERVLKCISAAIESKESGEIAYRIIHKSGKSVWVQLNFRFIEPDPDDPSQCLRLFAVFTGMSERTRLFQSIANDSADGIYIIGKDNFEIYYANEQNKLFIDSSEDAVGRKCYEVLHGKSEQCEYCPLRGDEFLGKTQAVFLPDRNRTYNMRFRETAWYGLPAYVTYVSDVTEEVEMRREKERLDQYFRIIVKNLSGGISVCYYDEKDDRLKPEFLSEGFAAMFGMTLDEAWSLYRNDGGIGVHPDDIKVIYDIFHTKLAEGKDTSFDMNYRLLKKDGDYLWIKNSMSITFTDKIRCYMVYSDISNEVTESTNSRKIFEELIYRNHQSRNPDLIMAGSCNLTTRTISRITDCNGEDIPGSIGADRDWFYNKTAEYIIDEHERNEFLAAFLTEPLLEKFARGTTKCDFDCFMRLPNEQSARYVRITVSLVRDPDTSDVTSILSVVDHTDKRVSDLVMHSLIKNEYDFISIIDLPTEKYSIISCSDKAGPLPDHKGNYIDFLNFSLNTRILARDREECENKLNLDYIKRALKDNKSFTLYYAVSDGKGGVRDKNLIVFGTDERLQKVGMARIDITESTGEQSRMLNALAYAFEIVSFIDVKTGALTMHTRDTLLSNLPPYSYQDFSESMARFIERYCPRETKDEMRNQMTLATILSRLEESPRGYEFSFPTFPDSPDAKFPNELCYKQVSVMWGDDRHSTVCMIRADVTDVIKKEHAAREHLQSALMIANEANRAKTDFLSSMSHDIRTPMNAIMGMTELALADRDNPDQIDESLAVIKSSSDHLLKLINEILDMSRIESGRLSLVHEAFSHKREFDKFIARSTAIAAKKNITFEHSINVEHDACMGDVVRLHQIFDNLVGNAVKFTPEGGTVRFEVTEMQPKAPSIGSYHYVVSDTGVGIREDSIKHILEPFYRTEESIVNGVEGSGLGLSIVKSILDYKGGTLEIESEVGKGSKFIVDIPMQFASTPIVPDNDKDKTDETIDLSGSRVLLVEDNPINSLVAEKLLERVGVAVDVAENGEEGAARFANSEAGTYDAIFMDIQMPIMDGYTATHLIRSAEHPQAKSIPIIAMTANAFNSDVKKCIDSGMNAHISKPVIPEKLYSILRTFVGGG